MHRRRSLVQRGSGYSEASRRLQTIASHGGRLKRRCGKFLSLITYMAKGICEMVDATPFCAAPCERTSPSFLERYSRHIGLSSPEIGTSAIRQTAYLEAFPVFVGNHPEKEAMSHPPEEVKPAQHQDSLNGYVAGYRICGLVAAGTSACFLGALADISNGPHRDGGH